MKKESEIKKLIQIANEMIGTPYKYGAYRNNTLRGKPDGVDCSSLIQYLFSRININLPRSSILQATKGKEVKSVTGLKPGDLIFFETTKGHYWHLLFSGKKMYIGHVALYVGSGDVIEASEDRNNGKVARIKLRDLTKIQNYNIVLIKRVIGIKPPKYSVPAYSQYLDIKNKTWETRACGIVSLKMVMDYWSRSTKNKYPKADELIYRYSDKAHINNIGWSHYGLAIIANRLGFASNNYDLVRYADEDALSFLEMKLNLGPVISSIYKNLNPKYSGHLVVITEIRNNVIFYNDPDSKTRKNIKRTATLHKFLKGWKKRIIVINQ